MVSLCSVLYCYCYDRSLDNGDISGALYTKLTFKMLHSVHLTLTVYYSQQEQCCNLLVSN